MIIGWQSLLLQSSVPVYRYDSLHTSMSTIVKEQIASLLSTQNNKIRVNIMDVQTQVAIKLTASYTESRLRNYSHANSLHYLLLLLWSLCICTILLVGSYEWVWLPMQQQQHTEAHTRRHLYGRKNDTFSGKVLPQSTVDEIIVHCYCRIPEINSASSKCLNWFHLFCTDNVTEECINDSKVVLLQLQLTCQHHTKMYWLLSLSL